MGKRGGVFKSLDVVGDQVQDKTRRGCVRDTEVETFAIDSGDESYTEVHSDTHGEEEFHVMENGVGEDGQGETEGVDVAFTGLGIWVLEPV
jgi:hypothetical protein